MATFRRLPSGKWQAQIARQGIRKSGSFETKQAARDWAAREEYVITNAKGNASGVPFSEVLDRYAREVSSKKRGEVWELRRINAYLREPFAAKRMRDLRTADFAEYRDKRLRSVSAGTIIRDLTLLSSIIHMARREWGLIDTNPISDVSRPRQPRPRDRIVTQDELDRMAHVAGDDLTVKMARAYHAFLFAVETAMRAGEIVGLDWCNVDLAQRVAHLPQTKNGEPRNVPLSSRAVALLEALPRGDGPVFDLSSAQLDVLWRKMRDKAGVTGLTFHDARHTAITRLAQKLDVLDLARMVGHKNVSQLMTYYNPTAADIARRLD